MYNKKLLQKSLCTQQKNLSSLRRDCNLPILTANEIIANLTQYELSQKKSDLLKAGLYFSIPPEKVQKSEIFTIFEKIHRPFLNNRGNQKSDKSSSAVFCKFLFLQLYNFSTCTTSKLSLRNLRKKKDTIITKPDKGNRAAILD